LNTTFVINGGAGRVITAIPALEKYARLNPDDDFKVIVHGWESLYWSHPLLQQKTFSIGQKGVFELLIKPNKLIVPEPYDRVNYYTQKKSLAECFDEEINNTDDHSDLTKPNLYLQKSEVYAVRKIIEEQKQKLNKSKVVVFQPYGSTIGIVNNRPYDSSVRSLDVDDYLKVAKEISKHALVVFFGHKDFVHPGDDFSFKPYDLNPDLRFWMTLISECDYFVGCDSVGQHMAYSFDKKGTVIMGSTFEKNVTYPEYFNIFRNSYKPTYSPIRIGGVDCEFSDRLNDNCMTFTDDELQNLTDSIINNITDSKETIKWNW
jgi:ADP-heptose:LPS heptosyltransferase